MNDVQHRFGPEFYRPLNFYSIDKRRFLIIDNVIRFDDPVELGIAHNPDIQFVARRVQRVAPQVYRSLDGNRKQHFYEHLVLLDRKLWEASLPIPARDRERLRITQTWVDRERARENDCLICMLAVILIVMIFSKIIVDTIPFGPGPR